MVFRSFLFFALLLPLAGCFALPPMEVTEKIDFNYQSPDKMPIKSADDMLCCYRCEA